MLVTQAFCARRESRGLPPPQPTRSYSTPAKMAPIGWRQRRAASLLSSAVFSLATQKFPISGSRYRQPFEASFPGLNGEAGREGNLPAPSAGRYSLDPPGPKVAPTPIVVLYVRAKNSQIDPRTRLLSAKSSLEINCCFPASTDLSNGEEAVEFEYYYSVVTVTLHH
jgi:hypothetical protein